MDAEYFKSIFQHQPQAVAFAPGRIELIGNHTDYNGGLAMGGSIQLGVTVAISPREDDLLEIHSATAPEPVKIALDQIRPQKDHKSWANYPLGIIYELSQSEHKLESGLNIAISSDLPTGAGLGSSAALELATLNAILKLKDSQMVKMEQVKLALRAENDFVGVPCGMLDQAAIAFGEKDHFVRIDCCNSSTNLVHIPSNVRFWLIDTHKNHTLAHSLYEERRVECLDAYLILKEVISEPDVLAHIETDDILDNRHLLNADLFARARHVTEEHDRVRGVENSLACMDMPEVGRLLNASHQSSRRLFQNSTEELDFLVDRLGVTDGVHGSRLTGAGFGGCVLVMTQADFDRVVMERLLERFEKRFGHKADIIEVSLEDGVRAE